MGAPGEVTQSALDMAIAGTAANSDAVTALNLIVSDPPTQIEMQLIADKLDELIAVLRRVWLSVDCGAGILARLLQNRRNLTSNGCPHPSADVLQQSCGESGYEGVGEE